jgi:hypothetical protein
MSCCGHSNTMNTQPSTPHPQPLLVDLVHEAYDNIQQSKYYYIRKRATDPSGNQIVLADYLALVIQKEEDTIAVDVKMCRLAESGGGDLWIASEGEEEIQIHDRTAVCTDDVGNSVWFFRPILPIESGDSSDTDNND